MLITPSSLSAVNTPAQLTPCGGGVDRQMDTYQFDWEHWHPAFIQAVNTIPLYRLGIGMLTEGGSTITAEEWYQRFSLMETFDIGGELEVVFWRLSTIDNHAWDTIYHFMRMSLCLVCTAAASFAASY